MTRFAFFVCDQLFTMVDADTEEQERLVPLEQVQFYCRTCGRVWAKRIALGKAWRYRYLEADCPFCPPSHPRTHTQAPWENFGPEFEAAHLILDLLTNRIGT